MTSVLILVDIQNDYFPGGNMELSGMQEAGLKAKDMLSFFRKRHWPIFHIQHIANNTDGTFFLPNTKGAELHECIKPLPEETVIQKQYPNSYRETHLLDVLKKTEIDQVVICGAMSHMCIDATTRAAADYGFECVVIHDGCATKNLEFIDKTISAQDVHGAFMASLGSADAKVLSSKEFLSMMKN